MDLFSDAGTSLAPWLLDWRFGMAHEQLTAWLSDAYAMEQGLIPILQNHANDVRTAMPDAAERIEQHIEETRTHAQRLEACLKQLGTSPSSVKAALSTMMGSIEAVSTGFFSDEPVKNVLMDYGAEQFEIGCYRALVNAARALGEERVAELCELNLHEDEEMALWLEDQIPLVVEAALGAIDDGQ
jgi:ferritin-like metal-binding protein YciE